MGTSATKRWRERVGRRRLETLVALVFLTVAVIVICLVFLVILREPPQKVAAEMPTVREAESSSEAPTLPPGFRGRGTVAPNVRVEIMPEVAGRVVYVHSQFHAGGLIAANEKILQVDPSGYKLAVRRARAAVDEAQARLDLALAATGAGGQGPDIERPADLPLALHGPQIRQAGAALEAAKAELGQAELKLARTSVVLPYDVLIADGTVGLGQYVEVGQSLAVACGTEAFEIEVPVPVEDLAQSDALREMAVPGRSPETSVAAEVRAESLGGEHTWPGEVVRATGRVDEGAGTVALIVEVPRPLEASGNTPPLLPGMAVEVFIPGQPQGDADAAAGKRGGNTTD